jgi:hypothetical protein
MSLLAISADSLAKIEQRLNDLESRSQYMARISETAPMNWHEFQQSGKMEPPRKWSFESISLGSTIGGLAALGLGFLVTSVAGWPASPLMYGVTGLGVGGLISGGMFPTKNDKREAQVMSYEKYLNEFEKSHSQVLSPKQETGLMPSSVPAPRPATRSAGL